MSIAAQAWVKLQIPSAAAPAREKRLVQARRWRRVARSVLATALVVLLSGCLDPLPDGPEPRDGPTVRFLAVGDTGTGGDAQHAVADAMDEVCARRGCDLVLLLGDNFYNLGVTGVDDPQFRSKFEVPYAELDVPFYPVLGNHDYGRGADEAWRAEAQVAYTDHSDRWTMPARVHAFGVGPARFLALDSGPAWVHGSPGQVDEAAVAAQRDWLAGALSESNATWNITLAHHPYRSNGVHGDAGSFDGVADKGTAWEGLLESACADLDLHLAGHDHDLQWLEPADACPDTHLVVSGAGARQREPGDNDHPARFEAYGTYGFAWLEATEEELTVAFYDGTGRLLHEGRVEA